MATSFTKPKGRGACPSYFVASCLHAARGQGIHSYTEAGYNLAIHLAREMPDDLDEAGQLFALEFLFELLNDGQDERAILAWFAEYLPRCLKLVPYKRRRQFLAGIYQAFTEEAIDWEG